MPQKPSSPHASLLLTTYEMPRHLELVFAGLEIQSFRDLEIFVCDDGSGPETTALIQGFKNRVDFPVYHLWQEHQGFRKCRILNQAARAARGNVFVFLDGDCIPHRHFLADHISQQESGYYLAGRRVELGPKFSSSLTPDLVRKGYFDYPRFSLMKSIATGDSEYLNRTIRIPSDRLRSLLGMDKVVDLKGCNYSIPRDALVAINGFDESFEGYGREDTDVELRLQNLGLKIKSLKGLALQYHIWHPRRQFTPSNDHRLEETRAQKRVQCQYGLRTL